MRRLAAAVALAAAALCGTLGCTGSGSAAASASPPGLVGVWGGHGRGIVIRADGTFTYSARTYRVCGQQPPPCDRFVGNFIYDGDNASGRISLATGNGVVTATTDAVDMPLGPIRIRSDPVGDRVWIGGVDYCGRQSAGTCGA